MKRCPNQNCDSTFMYGENKEKCPFCHSRLVDNISFANTSAVEIFTTDAVLMENEMENMETTPFVNRNLTHMVCHGRITEIDHHEVFYSKWHKLFNALIRNEPYQLAHQTAEYTIRVENITDGFPTDITDFCLYGSYLGRLQVGDEVIIRAKDRGDRRVVKSIYNQTTSSVVKPGFQIPAGIIRGIAIAVVLLILFLICEIVWLFKSGVVAAGMKVVVSAIMPIVIVCFGLWLIIRSVLPKRRNRRRY